MNIDIIKAVAASLEIQANEMERQARIFRSQASALRQALKEEVQS